MSTSSEPETTMSPGAPVRVRHRGRLCSHNGRTGWVAAIHTEHFPDGRPYVEVGVAWSIGGDVETWFRPDELEER